jgi:hypothetical protein
MSNLETWTWQRGIAPGKTRGLRQEARERNWMKNRWLVNLSGFAVESLDTASFLKKVREYDSRIQGNHRGDLTAAQREELDSSEKIVSLTG